MSKNDLDVENSSKTITDGQLVEKNDDPQRAQEVAAVVEGMELNSEPMMGDEDEYKKITLYEHVKSLESRLTDCESQIKYSNTQFKPPFDWFLHANHIRTGIQDILAPYVRRDKEVRDKINDLSAYMLKQADKQQEMDMELKELSSLRSDSFKNQILDELNTKYFSLRMEIEKREDKLMNKVEKWEEMLEQQRVRISDLFNKNHECKELVGILEEKMRKESLSECAHILK